MKYADMTEVQRLAWGQSEAAARIADLAPRGAEALKTAQANAETRRKAIGATRGQAANMVVEANRLARRAEFDRYQATEA